MNINSTISSIKISHVSLEQILIFIFLFAVGYLIIKIIVKVLEKSIEKSKLPKLTSKFIIRFTEIIAIIILIISILPIVGIDVSSIIIGLSAAIGLILSFGLQDTMKNLFCGIWLAITKPFEVGDYIEVNGVAGTLKSVGLMETILTTIDNRYIVIPNKLIWGSPLINYTKLNERIVELNVGVSYKTNLDKAISTLVNIMKKHKKILNNPKPGVMITKLGNSSINLQIRAWVKTGDYWDVKSDLAKEIIEEFRKKRIEIPYPQLDVHMKKF